MDGAWMTLPQVAEALGVRTATLRAQIARSRLAAVRRGRDWYVAPDEVARYRDEVQGHRGRPPSAIDAVVRLIAEHFERHAQWPETSTLQRRCVLIGIDVDLRQLALAIDPAVAHIDIGGVASLTVRGLQRAGASETLGDFEGGLCVAIARYRDPDLDEPAISSGDFARADMTSLRLRRMRIVLNSAWFITGSGGGSDDDWSYLVSTEIHRLGVASSVADYLAALDRMTAPKALLDLGPVSAWPELETRLQALSRLLAQAEAADDFADVGRRCREIVADLARVLDRGAPRRDPKGSLDAFLHETAVPGSDDLRALIRATLKLANHVTHDPRPLRAEATTVAQATVLLVRSLAAIDREAKNTRPLRRVGASADSPTPLPPDKGRQ
jgi:hypothetical protein